MQIIFFEQGTKDLYCLSIQPFSSVFHVTIFFFKNSDKTSRSNDVENNQLNVRRQSEKDGHDNE